MVVGGLLVVLETYITHHCKYCAGQPPSLEFYCNSGKIFHHKAGPSPFVIRQANKVCACVCLCVCVCVCVFVCVFVCLCVLVLLQLVITTPVSELQPLELVPFYL